MLILLGQGSTTSGCGWKKIIYILCLQETKVQDVDFPEQMFSEIGFQTEFTGQKSYNGVCILFNNQANLFCKELQG